MDEATKDILLKEFDTAWQQLFNIDGRRGVFFNYFNAAFFAVLTFTANVWTKGTAPTMLTAIALSATYVLLAFMAQAVKSVLQSERDANVRYRKKINLIREIFLGESDDPKIQKYLSRKDLGIKIETGDGNEIDRVGGTLKPIFLMLRVQQVALVVLAAMVWVAHCTLPGGGV